MLGFEFYGPGHGRVRPQRGADTAVLCDRQLNSPLRFLRRDAGPLERKVQHGRGEPFRDAGDSLSLDSHTERLQRSALLIHDQNDIGGGTGGERREHRIDRIRTGTGIAVDTYLRTVESTRVELEAAGPVDLDGHMGDEWGRQRLRS